MAQPSQPLTVEAAVCEFWDGPSPERAFTVAQLALGERMIAAGIDDGEIGEQVAALEEAIRRTQAVGGPYHALHAERERLVRRLADVALEDDGPLPGADAEYVAARQALLLLEQYERLSRPSR